MESFITKDGKRLRRGFTSGSCAAAAAKAAAIMLLGGGTLSSVDLVTPSGAALELPLYGVRKEENAVVCGVKKDSGDDPDVTNGMIFYSRVEKTASPREITIDGGEGVGRVTKPGLDQPVGAAAINSTPRRMILRELESLCEDYCYSGGLKVTVFVPGGEEAAKKTFNPRLGITGGISILGTTGIIEPMSDEAVVETVRAELSMRRAAGREYCLLTPGNYGAEFIKDTLLLDPASAVTTSNFIGEAFDAAFGSGFKGALLAGHIGKIIKLAAGMFNTHSRYGDGRREIFAAHAAACGADRAVVQRIMQSAVTDDMLEILSHAGLREPVLRSVTEAIEDHLSHRFGESALCGVITFSKSFGLLGETSKSRELLEKIRHEYKGE